MKIFIEPTLFLKYEFCDSAKSASAHTWRSNAESLVVWFDYLRAIKVPDWRAALRHHVVEYRLSLARAISPHTHRPYEPGTIRNRILAVVRFYEYAAEKDLYAGDIVGLTKRINSRRRKKKRSSNLVPSLHDNSERVKPLSVAEYKALADALGPRPSNRGTDTRPSRDRLIADIAIWVGLRVGEVKRLTIHQFQVLTPDPKSPWIILPLRIFGKGSRGRGLKPRTVGIASWLVTEINAYIDGERSEAVRKGKLRDHGALFVSDIVSNQPGAALSVRRYEQIVEEACIAAKLVRKRELIDPETNRRYTIKAPSHCFHDFRHTCAVWMYWVELENGNPEPWKKIQAQLGHALLQTTTDIYLKFVELFRNANRAVNVFQMLGI